MSVADMLVTFTKANKSVMVFQAVSDIENTKAIEIDVEPGAVERVGPMLPRRFSMMIEVSDDLRNLPAVGIGGKAGEFTRNRNAKQQWRQLESLVGKNVLIDARAVADPTAVYTVESVRAIDGLNFETGFKVQLTCTEDLSGSLTGEGLGELERVRLQIPVKPTVPATEGAPLGGGDNMCTTVVPIKKKQLDPWIHAVGYIAQAQFEKNVDDIKNMFTDAGEALREQTRVNVSHVQQWGRDFGKFLDNSAVARDTRSTIAFFDELIFEDVTVTETRVEKCPVGTEAP